MGQWDAFKTWDLVLPPSRPSAFHLKEIRRFLQRGGNVRRAAVLGSTPEFRDLLCELDCKEIYVFDSNESFYRSMSSLRAYANYETFVHGDWLETLPRFAGCFSVVLSDLTMGNVPYETRQQFYDCIVESLAPKGLFVDKVLTHDADVLRINELVEKYRELPLNLRHVNDFSCEFLFCSELIQSRQVVDTTRFYDHLNETIEHPRIRKFLQMCTKITPRNCLWYYGKHWRDLKSEYFRNFRLIQTIEDEAGSPYVERLKVFVHEKGSEL